MTINKNQNVYLSLINAHYNYTLNKVYNAAIHFVLKNKNDLRYNISPTYKAFKRDRKISYIRQCQLEYF